MSRGLLVLVLVAGLAFLLLGGKGGGDEAAAAVVDPCDEADLLDKLKAIVADPGSCLTATGDFRQVFYTWESAAFSDVSSSTPTTESKVGAKAFTQGGSTSLRIEHASSDDEVQWSQVVSVGEMAVVQVVYHDLVGGDVINVYLGDSLVFTAEYA